MPKVELNRLIQAPPFCMQIELCEGCNLRCSFCGLNGIRGKENNPKLLTMLNAKLLANRIVESNWHPRIEFAMHGEPTLNPDAVEIVSIFRKTLGKSVHLMMTSNGGGILKSPTEIVDGLLKNLNVLALDAYEGVSIVPRILQNYKGIHKPVFYPKEQAGNPHRRRKSSEHDFVIVEDISKATKGTHSTLNNHAGCGAPKDDSANGKRCAKPFRELSVRWDGNISVCCNDWRGYYKCGNAFDQSLEAIWQGPEMIAARKKLYHGERDFGPCDGCNALSYRPGLLPDLKGLQSLPQASNKDKAVIANALAGEPYTKPVPRKWELTQIT